MLTFTGRKGSKKPRSARKKGSIIYGVKKNPELILENTVFIQNWLRPALTPVLHNRGCCALVDELEKLDQALKVSGLGEKAIEYALDSMPE